MFALTVCLTTGAQGWRVGVTAGADCNTYSMDMQYMNDFRTEGRWGATLGVSGQYNFTDWLGVRADDNGKTYPTIIAPGQGIISAASSYDSQSFVNGAPNTTNANAVATIQPKVVKNGRDNWYILEQGTSMSCPHAAGIVALWMQAKPTLNVNDIKSILKETCVNDEWTTTLANIPSGNKIQAGYGKIDALAGLKKILATDGIEVIGADGRREATPATMYSVDAPVYNMMGQQVDKSHKGLVIYKGRKYMNK